MNPFDNKDKNHYLIISRGVRFSYLAKARIENIMQRVQPTQGL